MIRKTLKTSVCVWEVFTNVNIDLVTFQWSEWRKTVQLTIITLAAIVPDFDSGIGKCQTERTPYQLVFKARSRLFAYCRHRVHLRARETIPYHSWRDQ
jgi:hypothetical protein